MHALVVTRMQREVCHVSEETGHKDGTRLSLLMDGPCTSTLKCDRPQ